MAGLIECSRSFTIVRPELAFLDAGDSLDRAPLVTLGDMAALPGDAAWRVTRTRMLVSNKQSDPANSRRHQCPSHRNPNIRDQPAPMRRCGVRHRSGAQASGFHAATVHFSRHTGEHVGRGIGMGKKPWLWIGKGCKSVARERGKQ
jgi:hypothetical protein